MRQSINLYTAELKPRVDWLSLKYTLGYVGALTFVLATVSAADLLSRRDLAAALTTAQVQQERWLAEIVELERVIEERAKDPALEAEVVQLERFQKDKLTLRRFLSQEVPGNADGFSTHFADLARYHGRGLRLTEVGLDEGGAKVRLRGEVVRGEYITNYIAGLNRSPTFRGKAFRNIELDRKGTVIDGLPEGQSLVFEIRTGEAKAR